MSSFIKYHKWKYQQLWKSLLMLNIFADCFIKIFMDNFYWTTKKLWLYYGLMMSSLLLSVDTWFPMIYHKYFGQLILIKFCSKVQNHKRKIGSDFGSYGPNRFGIKGQKQVFHRNNYANPVCSTTHCTIKVTLG